MNWGPRGPALSKPAGSRPGALAPGLRERWGRGGRDVLGGIKKPPDAIPRFVPGGSPPLGITCFPCQKGRCHPATLRSRIQHSPGEEAARPNSTQSLRGRMPQTVGFKWGVEAAAPLHKRPSPSLLTQPDWTTSGPWPSAKRHEASSILGATQVEGSGSASSRRFRDVPLTRWAARPRMAATRREGAGGLRSRSQQRVSVLKES